MKYLLSLGILFGVLASSAYAVVDGFATTLMSGGNTSYTVPSGKVLVLQQVSLPSAASGSLSSITIRDAGGSSTTVPVPGANTNLYKFSPNLFLPAGTTVSGPLASGPVGFYGLLVDTSDMYLFVTVTSTLGNVQLANNTVTGMIHIASTAPVRVNIESSTDLLHWAIDTSAVVRTTASKSIYTFAAVNPGQDRFYRALVRRINS